MDKYLYDYLEVGDIIFVRGNSIISKLINKVDGGEFSHTAIYIGNGKVLEAQRFTKTRVVDFYFDDFFVFETNLTAKQKYSLWDQVSKFTGLNYDYAQIVSIFIQKLFKLKKRVNNRNNFICSELIVEILYNAGIINKNFREKAIDSTPNELYEFLKLNFK